MRLRREIGGHDQAAVRYARARFNGVLDIGSILYRAGDELDCERRSQGLCRMQVKGRHSRLIHETGMGEPRRNLLEHRQPFARDAGLIQHEAGQIAPWSSQTGDES